MANLRRKLSDILNGGDDSFRKAWSSTAAARDNSPLPRGTYICHAISGEPATSKEKNTPGYKITFKVIEGDYTDRLVWYDLWFTAAALPRAKRELTKLGITEPEQMDQPLPPGIRCKVVVALRKDDDGIERDDVRRFEVIGIDEAPPNPYAPDTPPAPEKPVTPAASADAAAAESVLPDHGIPI